MKFRKSPKDYPHELLAQMKGSSSLKSTRSRRFNILRNCEKLDLFFFRGCTVSKITQSGNQIFFNYYSCEFQRNCECPFMFALCNIPACLNHLHVLPDKLNNFVWQLSSFKSYLAQTIPLILKLRVAKSNYTESFNCKIKCISFYNII